MPSVVSNAGRACQALRSQAEPGKQDDLWTLVLSHLPSDDQTRLTWLKGEGYWEVQPHWIGFF